MDTARRGFSEFTISTATNPRCGDGRVFLSARDGQGAKIVAFGSINLDDMRPKAFKAMIVRENASSRSVTYQSAGRDWIVLSGFQGADVYYEKTIFYCGVTATVTLTYPKAEKQAYDAIVKRVSGSLRPGRGIATSMCR